MSSKGYVLVPVHDSPSSRAALERGRELARALGVRMRVLSVSPIRALAASDHMVAAAAAAWPAEPGDWLGLEPRVDHLELVGDPFAVILAESERPDVELLVIGHGERGWLARGGVAPLHERLVRSARVPVLVVPAGPEHRTLEPLAPVRGRGRLSLAGSSDRRVGPPPRLRVLSGGRAPR